MEEAKVGGVKVEEPKVAKAPEVEKTFQPKDLATKMGISPKRLRAMLREEHPREVEVKGKRWEIPISLAKEVEKAYKEKVKAREAKKQAEIKAQLEGKA